MCLSKYKSKPNQTRNIVQSDFMISSFDIDTLYIFTLNPDKYKSYIEEAISPEKIQFIDIIDVSKKGYSLVIEIHTKDRFLVVFENPFDLNTLIKLINKARENREEKKKSQLNMLKFNIDYFENLLRTEVQKEFTLQVIVNKSLRKLSSGIFASILPKHGVVPKILMNWSFRLITPSI